MELVEDRVQRRALLLSVLNPRVYCETILSSGLNSHPKGTTKNKGLH